MSFEYCPLCSSDNVKTYYDEDEKVEFFICNDCNLVLWKE